MPDSLARKITLTEAAEAFVTARDKILEGFRLVRDAELLLERTFSACDSEHFYVRNSWGRVVFENPKEVIDVLNKDVWGKLIERSGVKQHMSIASAKELDEQVSKGQLPPITLQSMKDLVSSLVNAAPEMHKEAVLEVFEWLRPRRSKHKTNSEYEIPGRVILTHRVGNPNPLWSMPLTLNWEYEQDFRALENVFSALDGKGIICKNYNSQISNALKATNSCEPHEVETDYFKVRVFKNGNMHLTFKRADLLAQLNRIAGGARLRK